MGEKGEDTLEESRSGERTDQGLAAVIVARGSDVADGATEGGQPTEQLGLSEAPRAAAYEGGRGEGCGGCQLDEEPAAAIQERWKGASESTEENSAAIADELPMPVTAGAGAHGGGRQLAYGKGHKVARAGSVTWCLRCGAHAEERVGVVVAKVCTPVLTREKSRHAYRRILLQRGLHPITKAKLE